jgi:hypothetical protein
MTKKQPGGQDQIPDGFKNLIVLNGKVPVEDNWQKWCTEPRPDKPKKKASQNYGIPCGPANGIIVLDVDDKEKFTRYCETHNLTIMDVSLKETFTVETGNGYHFYFSYPQNGHSFGNKSFKNFGFDIRGVGGQVVAPGGIHPESGKAYQVANYHPPAPMPGWIKSLYKETEKPKQKNTAYGSFTGDIEKLPIKQSTKELIKNGVPVGQRSEAIMTVINALVYASLSDAEIFQIFESYPIGEKYREKGNGRERWLQPQIDKARATVTDRAEQQPDKADGKKKQKQEKTPQAELLLEIAKGLDFYHDEGGNVYANLPVDGHHEFTPLNGRFFKDWLSNQYYYQKGCIANSEAITAALRVLNGQGRYNSPEVNPCVRLAENDKKIFLDLCNKLWKFQKPVGGLSLNTRFFSGDLRDAWHCLHQSRAARLMS